MAALFRRRSLDERMSLALVKALERDTSMFGGVPELRVTNWQVQRIYPEGGRIELDVQLTAVARAPRKR